MLRNTVGDYVNLGSVLVDVYGPAAAADERRLGGMIALGDERTIDQDPAFAMRILVDVAIRALSPAVNDPTTATQALNHLGVLLLGISVSGISGRGALSDDEGTIRLAVPTRSWDDYLELGVTEIRRYGATSPQTVRQLRAMLQDLETSVLPADRPAVRRELATLRRTVELHYPDSEDRAFASNADSQGIGGASRAAWPGESAGAEV